MRKLSIILLTIIFSITGCITIEDEPLVTVSPAIEFQGYIQGEEVHVTATVRANPTFVNPGNIPTVFEYEGELELYNGDSGALLTSSDITGDGLSTIAKAIADADAFEKIVIVASGSVSAFADKDSDGDRSNDLFLHKASFYEVINMSEVINLQDYPVIIMEPTVEFQPHIRGTELFTTSVVAANPDYLNSGSFPILFGYDGVIQVYDETSGALLKSSALTGSGLTNAVTVVVDTTSFDGFVIIASGTITCTGDVDSDGESANDIFISSAEFYGLLEVDLTE